MTIVGKMLIYTQVFSTKTCLHMLNCNVIMSSMKCVAYTINKEYLHVGCRIGQVTNCLINISGIMING